MKNSFSIFLSAIFCLVLTQCQRPATKLSQGAMIVKEGFIDCFEAGLQAGGKDVWCEASAILYDGKNVTLANDKDMPGANASVFYWAYADMGTFSAKPTYLTQSLLKAAQKYEDFALTPNGKVAFLTTAFDRIKEGSHEWDTYNTLLYWLVGNNPQQIQPKAVHLVAGEKFSVSLRNALSKALTSPEFPNGMPYFKIEGLAATQDKLYFGVREEGKQYDNFKYKAKVLTASYHMAGDSLIFENNLQTMADINIAELHPSLPKPLALSCIEYDVQRKIFWVLTSMESDTQSNCAYLWWATENDLKNNKLNLVYDRAGQPLKFNHKAEDLTLVGAHRLLVIHDDDRNRTKIGDQTRQPHQAAYSVVEF
ncbi:hypothetical protein P1X15_09445 [Runella sp. MFBS21]|uniref:hypothetical protein n=1 Tax=Runella sp. MFBS21 TaxID=3034018 RepID=UPI0023F63B91|nr:hypothetical protein [Runella sp. MFBS21]MDF7817821.1 hypothetical protein [Runella sp. MFBS21]